MLLQYKEAEAAPPAEEDEQSLLPDVSKCSKKLFRVWLSGTMVDLLVSALVEVHLNALFVSNHFGLNAVF